MLFTRNIRTQHLNGVILISWLLILQRWPVPSQPNLHLDARFVPIVSKWASKKVFARFHVVMFITNNVWNNGFAHKFNKFDHQAARNVAHWRTMLRLFGYSYMKRFHILMFRWRQRRRQLKLVVGMLQSEEIAMTRHLTMNSISLYYNYVYRKYNWRLQIVTVGILMLHDFNRATRYAQQAQHSFHEDLNGLDQHLDQISGELSTMQSFYAHMVDEMETYVDSLQLWFAHNNIQQQCRRSSNSMTMLSNK